MPQNPVKTTLFVSQLKAGNAIKLTPTGGAGIVTVEALAGPASTVPQQKYNAVSTAPTTNNLDLTGAEISGGAVLTSLNLTAALGAGATATLPTVANLVTALDAAGITPVAGGSYELDVTNSSSGAFAWTITTNTGWTLDGTMTVAQDTTRRCIVTFTSLTAAVLQSLGQFANAGV